MAKTKITGTEFDSFFVNQSPINGVKEEEIQENINTELQNSDIAEKQNTDIAELQKAKKPKKQKVAKRDDPEYKRVTVSISRKKFKLINDYKFINNIKTFDDALDLFISDKPPKSLP